MRLQGDGNTCRDRLCGCRANGSKIIVNVVAGFLGAGKTTTMNYLLSATNNQRLDVLVREYGNVSVDHRLLNGVPEEKIHFYIGTSKHDDPQILLHDYLHRLASERGSSEMDHLLLETSGLDTPDRVIQLFMIGYMPDTYELGSFITIVDAKYGMETLNEYEIAVEQIAYADFVVINKTDLASEENAEALEKRIRSINRMAKIIRTSYGVIDPEMVLDVKVYDQLRLVNESEIEDTMTQIKTITLSSDKALNMDTTNAWINGVFTKFGSEILRGKGFLSFSEIDYRYEFQSVRESFHSYAREKWAVGEKRQTVIVLICKSDVPEAELMAGFERCYQ